MVELSKREDLARWLKDKPREWMAVIAMRVVLRIVPMLAADVGLRGRNAAAVGRNSFLPAMAGTAVQWVAVIWRSRRAEIRDAAQFAAFVLDRADRGGNNVVHAANAAAHAAIHPTQTAEAAAGSGDAVSYAIYTLQQEDRKADLWVAISADANALEGVQSNSLAPAGLALQALWPTGAPPWVSEHWTRLKSTLLILDEDWEVWTDWYEARLRGGPSNESLELARVMIAEEIWQQGPKVVNAHIKELIKQYAPPPAVDSIPSQESEALVFGGSDDAPIGQIDPPGVGLADTADQRQGHADIREKAGQLEAHCGQSNRLAVLKAHAAKLFAAAGESLLDLRVRAFWSQLNSLRRRHEAELRARVQSDPDTPALPEDVAGVLQDLVETLNVFAAHEPKLTALDDMSRDPSDRVANDRTVQAARSIAEGATRAPQAVDADAASALSDVALEAVGDTPSALRSKEFTTKSARNLVLEALRRAYKGALGEAGFAWKGAREGAYRFGGAAGASYGAALFIKANEASVRTLIDTLGGSATLQHIVDLIIKILS